MPGDAALETILKTVALAGLTYMAIAMFAFGSAFQPILLALQPNRLGVPHWPWIVLASFAVGGLCFLAPARLWVLRGPAFAAIGLGGSLLGVGAYADELRSTAVKEFGAERQMQHSFLESVRHAPNEFPFFLHAAVMKDCVPFAWSYRTMSFYPVPLRAAINVMPGGWLKECSIHREDVDKQ